MFRDVYKAANDCITPNPELLKSILSNSSQSKPEKVHFRPAFSLCAAALALVIALPSILNRPPQTGEQMMDNSPKYSQDITISQNPASENENSAMQPESVQRPVPSPVDSLASDMAVVMTINNISPTPKMISEYDALGESLDVQNVEMSAGEYFNYVGFSPLALDLPDGLNADFEETSAVIVSKSGEEITSDIATFTFSGDPGFVSVTTSTDLTDVKSDLDDAIYEKSKFYETDAVILFDGSSYETKFVLDDKTAVKIATAGLNEEQLKTLIISAIK